ncbi:hypothetical protein BC828DRAFT_405132 [Blastocladiella britannica]|nr:hypothetical protein BC828DRAFT_405132 [Blastocladiella britannica]
MPPGAAKQKRTDENSRQSGGSGGGTKRRHAAAHALPSSTSPLLMRLCTAAAANDAHAVATLAHSVTAIPVALAARHNPLMAAIEARALGSLNALVAAIADVPAMRDAGLLNLASADDAAGGLTPLQACIELLPDPTASAMAMALLDAGAAPFAADSKDTMVALLARVLELDHHAAGSSSSTPSTPTLFARLVTTARSQLGGASLDTLVRAGDGWTLLQVAAALGSPAHVRILLDRAAMDPSSAHDRTWPASHIAAQAGRTDILALLLDAGCPVDNRSSTSGQTPLHVAAAAGQLATVQFLVRAPHAANVHAIDTTPQGLTPPLAAAAAIKTADALAAVWAMLAESKTKSKASGKSSPDNNNDITQHLSRAGESATDLALAHGHVESATWLLVDAGCPVRKLNAAAARHLPALVKLINAVADRARWTVTTTVTTQVAAAAEDVSLIEIGGSGDLQLSPILPTSLAATVSSRQQQQRLTRSATGDSLESSNSSVVEILTSSRSLAANTIAIATTSTTTTSASTPGAFAAPSSPIGVRTAADAARVLVAAIDSHLGDAATAVDSATALRGSMSADTPLTTAAAPAAQHDAEFAALAGLVGKLAAAGVASGLDAVGPAIARAAEVLASGTSAPTVATGVDLAPALAAMRTAVAGVTDGLAVSTTTVSDLQAADGAVRALADDTARGLREFSRLQAAKDYLAALACEDRWMAAQIAVLARQAELVRKVDAATARQRTVAEAVARAERVADAALAKDARAIDDTARAVEAGVHELVGVRGRVQAAVRALEVEWRGIWDGEIDARNDDGEDSDNSEVDITPKPSTTDATASTSSTASATWLAEFLGLFVHMEHLASSETTKDGEPNTATMDSPRAVLTRMLQWYLEVKAGAASAAHASMSHRLSSLRAHAECLTLLTRATGWAMAAAAAHARSGLATLQGQALQLRTALPDAYNVLHARLVFNERLCKKNLADIQADLQRALADKNRAFEARRVADLARCEEHAGHLNAALEKEEKRLMAIEALMQRAFATANRYLSPDRVEQVRTEYLELGVLLRFSTPVSSGSTTTSGTGTSAAGTVRASRKRRRRPSVDGMSSDGIYGMLESDYDDDGLTARPGTGSEAGYLSFLSGETAYGSASHDADEDGAGQSDTDADDVASVRPPPRKAMRLAHSTDVHSGGASSSSPSLFTRPLALVRSVLSFSWLLRSQKEEPAESEDEQEEYRRRLREATLRAQMSHKERSRLRRRTARPNSVSAVEAESASTSMVSGNSTTFSALAEDEDDEDEEEHGDGDSGNGRDDLSIGGGSSIA